jgi:transcriptional regulator with XRE-family HTH domain
MHNIVTSAQLRMARAAVGWTVRELSERAGVHRNTITRLEAGAAGESRTIAALAAALSAAGVTFIPENEDLVGDGVCFRPPK